MLIYSGEFCTADNGNGYSIKERDAICSNCHKVVDRQIQYVEVDKGFKFTGDKEKWKYCPYCGKQLVESDER